jgi:hypothetical protein
VVGVRVGWLSHGLLLRLWICRHPLALAGIMHGRTAVRQLYCLLYISCLIYLCHAAPIGAVRPYYLTYCLMTSYVWQLFFFFALSGGVYFVTVVDEVRRLNCGAMTGVVLVLVAWSMWMASSRGGQSGSGRDLATPTQGIFGLAWNAQSHASSRPPDPWCLNPFLEKNRSPPFNLPLCLSIHHWFFPSDSGLPQSPLQVAL